jgi:sugar lactone lactonase YvrE
VNIEERQLADVLHRVTPEPPRRVTVEQVAYRLVSEPWLRRESRPGRAPRPRRGSLGLSRAWAPVMAAAAVVVIAGASAGVAVLASSHHTPPSPVGGGATSSSVSSAPVSSSPSRTPAQTQQTTPTTPIVGGPWGAELIDHQTFTQGSLVSADGSLYAYGTGTLDRIDPATGTIAASAPYNPPLPNPPVIVGNTVWVVWSYSGGNVVLHGYDAQTLAQTSSVQVPATGAVASSASTVLTSGPDGHLYVAAGVTVVGVDPATGQIVQRIFLTAGTASSVAVSPDGTRLYVAVAPSPGGSKLVVYDLTSDNEVSATSLAGTDSGGNLIATSGGVWGTTGVGMSEWTWFAPDGDMTRAVRIGAGAGAGFASLPSYSGGVVWVGGSHTLTCASPADGRTLDTATLPTDHSVVEYFGSPAVAGGHAYSYYQDDAAQLSGVVRMTPPAACQ